MKRASRGLKGAGRELQGSLKETSRGLEGGFKRLQGDLKPSEGEGGLKEA